MKVLFIVLIVLVALLIALTALLWAKIRMLNKVFNTEYTGIFKDIIELKENVRYLQLELEKLKDECEKFKNPFKDLSKMQNFGKYCNKMAEDLKTSKTKPDKSLEQALSEIYQTFDALAVCIEEAIIKAYGPEEFELAIKANETKNKRKE